MAKALLTGASQFSDRARRVRRGGFRGACAVLALVILHHGASASADETSGAEPKADAASAPVVGAPTPAVEAPAAPVPAPADGGVAAAGKPAEALATEESLARYQQLLQKRPFHVPAFNGLVAYNVERNTLPQLVAEYEQRVESLPDESPLRIVLARLYLRAGQPEKAASTIDALGELPPAHARLAPELLVFKAEVYQRVGRNDAARDMLRQARDQARSIAEKLKLAEALADLHVRTSEPKQAAAVLVELAGQFPDQYLHRRHIADALAERKLHEAAVEEYAAVRKLVENQPDKKCEVLRRLGISQEALGLRDEAIASYTEAVNLLASDHWLQRELHERIVNLYRATNRLQDLATYCQAQIKRAPEQISTRLLLADVQLAMGNADAGAKTIDQAIELFPADLALSQRRIELLERQGDAPAIEAAASEYARAIAHHPDETELYIAYGQFLASHKQIDAARAQWRSVLQTRLTVAALASRLGSLFETYELYDDAVEAYERAIALSPDTPEPYTTLSRLWLLRGDQEKAVAVLQRAASANSASGPIHADLAQAMYNLGQTDQALALIARACELSPGEVRFQTAHSDLLVHAGRLEEALEIRRQAVELLTSASQRADAIAVLISMHATAGRLPLLKQREQERLQAQPEDAVSLLILARAADAERDFKAAREWLTKLLDVQPGNELALQHLARLLDAVGDVDGAIATYQKLIDLHPARSRPQYEAIVDLKLRYGDKAGAVATLEQLVRDNPGSANVLKGAAEQLVRIGDPERALAQFEQSLQIQGDQHDVRLSYGKALVAAGRLEDAVAAFRAVATQRTDTDSAVDALSQLHDTATQLGELDELINALQGQVDADPENTLIARALAQLLVQEFEYGRAMEMLNVAQRNNPRDADIALARAELLRRLAQFDEAVEAYQSILRMPQIDRDYVLGEMGKAYFESGQLDQARRVWRQVQHRLYAGSLLKNNGLFDDAVAVLQEGIRFKPDDFALHRALILALHAAGKPDDALQAARRLLDLEPGNVLNIEQLAKAYLERGDRAAAAEVAGRLFSAGVAGETPAASAASGQTLSLKMAIAQARYSQYGWWGYQQAVRKNLDRGIEFFRENGLVAELEEVLEAQMASQPDNAALRRAAGELFSNEFGKPEKALVLLRELATAEFPIEQQSWLGECSQRDFFRVKEYNLIARMPALRDARLTALESKPGEQLSRDEVLELAVIRGSQGATDRAIELLTSASGADDGDTLARGMLVDLLIGAERFADAEPHAKRLAAQLDEERTSLQSAMIERVRRDFVRALPLEFQLRVNEQLLADIARKWTLGEGLLTWNGVAVQSMGYLRVELTLATIYARTGRMDEARAIWLALAPPNAADSDTWTALGSVAQLYDQQDLALQFYQRALQGAKLLTADPLMQQIYGGSSTQSWYGEQEAVDTSFSKIVEAFARQGGLVELYDFLRETEQPVKARQIGEQYKLYAKLRENYEQQVAEARTAYRSANKSAAEGAAPVGGAQRMNQSVPYFAQVCKLTEVLDRSGHWDDALQVYRRYLEDFPDELGLLITLGEVAEAQGQLAQAIEWEKAVLEAKARLARQARQWSQRELSLTPSRPSVLDNARADAWSWQQRWGRNRWGYWTMQQQLDRTASWMRLARLYLADKKDLAAADAMQHAVADAGADRSWVTRQALEVIQQRQLTARMLPVLRTLAMYQPADEQVQLAFGEALEGNNRREVAAEVYQRMLRRGVSSLGVLAQVKRKVESLAPGRAGSAAVEATLAGLEAEVKADPANVQNRLRLAKAYYYDLQMDRALETALALQKDSPQLEELHDLLVEIHTLRGESEPLIEALQAQIARATEDDARRTARWRLVDELLGAGRTEEALATLKELGDPREPWSYQRIGALFHYFGRHDDAIACFQLAGKSQSRSPYGGDDDPGHGVPVARGHVLKGDFAQAADAILKSIDEQGRQQMQYGGMWDAFSERANVFGPYRALFVLNPALADEIRQRVEQRWQASPDDVQVARLLIQLHRAFGRPDLAVAMVDALMEKGSSDQKLVVQLIDRSIRKRDFEKAVTLAKTFIAQQPKPKVPPGVPPQYAGMAVLQSTRTLMLCKLGDVYWEMGEKEQAFETYRQIIDDQVDETRLAYAAICLMRGRTDEVRTLVNQALGGEAPAGAEQGLKSPRLLQLRALVSAMDGKLDATFDDLAEAVGGSTAAPANPWDDGRTASPLPLLGMLARQGSPPGGELLERYRRFMDERIAGHPNEWEGYNQLSAVLFDVGRPEEGLAVLDRAAENSSLTLQAVGAKLSRLQGSASIPDLIAMNRQLIELSERQVGSTQTQRYGGYQAYGGPGMAGPSQAMRDRLGDLLWTQGEREEAERVWSERVNQQQGASHARMAQRFLDREVLDRAEQALDKALELDPENAQAHLNLAELAFRRGDRDATRAHLLAYAARAREASLSPRADMGESSQGQNWRLTEMALDLTGDAPGAGPGIVPTLEVALRNRILLSWLVGDWSALDSAARERLDSCPFDPVAWLARGLAQERAGHWEEAARAWEFLRRARLTSLAEHRQKLKLVLAGKQIKEAAAGTRQSRNPANPQMPQGSSGRARYGQQYGMYDEYGGSEADSTTARLAATYVRLGSLDKAERLYLSAQGSGLQSSLPALAMLMWDQPSGGRDRALELMRLAVLFSNVQHGGGDLVPRYASMLAEAGQVPAAVEVLVRSYRWPPDDEASNAYSSLYGYAQQNQQALESWTEQSVAAALHGILVRAGAYDRVVQQLATQAAAEQGDSRLLKLVLSLQLRQRQWDEAQRSALAWRNANPDAAAVKTSQLKLHLQGGQWDDALKLLEELRRDAPRQNSQWRMHEAFIHLARHDHDAVGRVLQPLAAGAGEEDESEDEEGAQAANPLALWTALAAARQYDMLAAHLQEQRRLCRLNDAGTELLIRVNVARGRWGEALRLGLDELWKESAPIARNEGWFRLLVVAVRAAEAAGATPEIPGDPRTTPEDVAIIGLITRGAESAVGEFQGLVARGGDGPGAVNARRGLILAAGMASDHELARRANQELLDWLRARRLHAWQMPPTPPLADSIRSLMAQQSRGASTATVLSGGMGPQLLSSLLGNPAAARPVVTYEELWQSHQQLHRELVARCADVNALRTMLEEEAKRGATASGYSDEYSAMAYASSMGQPYYGAYNYQYGGRGYGERGAGWQGNLRQMLWRFGRLDALSEEYHRAARGVPGEEWLTVAEVAAANGDADDARDWRSRRCDIIGAWLRAGDRPKVTSGAQARAWRWYWYDDSSAQRVEAIRHALAGPAKMPGADSGRGTESLTTDGEIDQLWELALVEPRAEALLLESAAAVGPGWGETQAVEQLIRYFRAKNDHGRIIDLLDKVYELDEIAQSGRLDDYLVACFAARRLDRVEPILARVKEFSSDLENDVAMLRLVTLRMQGRGPQADELEQQLLARCVVESPNPSRLEACIQDSAPQRQRDQRRQQAMEMQRYSYGAASPYYRGMSGGENPDWRTEGDLPTLVSLARALGVQYQGDVAGGDMTLWELRDRYARHDLPLDAARIADLELKQATSDRDRIELLQAQAVLLKRGGRAEDASRAAGECERLIAAELKANPADAQLQRQLAALLRCEAGGSAYGRAGEAFRAARRLDPASVTSPLQEVNCLFDAGDFEQAWQGYRDAIQRGWREVYEHEALPRAALAAEHAGDREAAARLARQTLWRFPLCARAAEVKEIVHEP